MKQMKLAGSMLALVTMVLAAGPASAAMVFYVGANGIDTATCGAVTRPCRTIQHVVVVAASGDRIVVGPGTYSGFALDKAVALESTNGAAATIIEGDPAIVVDEGANGAVIGKASKGFTIRGGQLGIAVAATDVRIEDNVVTAVLYGVTTGPATSRLTLTGNVISARRGVVVFGIASSVVQNVIEGVPGGTGVELAGEGGLLSDNVVTGTATGASVQAGTATVRRNTFAANGVGLVILNSGPSLAITSNNFLGNVGPFGNCGLFAKQPGLVAKGNYWGSETGPGADPADDVCQNSVVTAPFSRTPVPIAGTAGR